MRFASDKTSRILDVGCNVGRHLDALQRLGYRHLSGVDVQTAAWEEMAQAFPELTVTAHRGTFQEQLPLLPSRGYDVVFTYGATVELVPLSFDICRELARLTNRWLIVAIDESHDRFPRDWRLAFQRRGLLVKEATVPIHCGSRQSLLVYETRSCCFAQHKLRPC